MAKKIKEEKGHAENVIHNAHSVKEKIVKRKGMLLT